MPALGSHRAAVWVLFGLLLGCGSHDADDAPSADEAQDEIPVPVPTPTPAWPGAPEGFEPVVLPEVTDDCEGPVVFVGPQTVTRTPPLEDEDLQSAPRSELAPGVEREVSAQMQPAGGTLGVLRAMTGSYNGPGGEPLFRWHLERTAAAPILVFDRRVPRERFVSALRGAEDGVPLRLGGVDGSGARRCAIVLAAEPSGLGAQPTNAMYEGRLDDGGGLRARGPNAERPLDHVEVALPLPGEPDEGLHVIRFDGGRYADTPRLLRALAAARWSERRYGWLELPRSPPYCLPLVSGCGCAEGCARGLRHLDDEPPEGALALLEPQPVMVQTAADTPPIEGQLARWCFDRDSGRMTPMGRHGGDCFEVYVVAPECGGECVPRQRPDCGRCEACDASCAGEPIP